VSNQITVRPVSSWGDRRRFQQVPWSIYAAPGKPRDPNWVPPILSQERQLLGWARHPFFDNAEMVTLLAERDGRTLGRLAVLINRVHNRAHGEARGFFGFFECVDDEAVAGELIAFGASWLRNRGMTTMRGPVNPSMNYTCGLLVDGFDRQPRIMMTYNPSYYPLLLESCGFTKSHDLFAYEVDKVLLATLKGRYRPAVLAAIERSKLVLRPFDPRRYDKEIETYLDIYNRSLEGTWGFTPLQQREAKCIAAELRHVIVPEFAVFAELDGTPVGATLALLDYNQILGKLNGRLMPFGYLRLLAGRRHISAARAMAVTMVPGYQSAGLGIVLMDHLVSATERWGVERFECSWVLESNSRSRGSLERVGAKLVSTYRLYDMTV
jgi:GNAT superfamily N-acetyltransferase